MKKVKIRVITLKSIRFGILLLFLNFKNFIKINNNYINKVW